MSSKKIFFLLISLYLIISHETNKTEEPKEKNEVIKESNTTNNETKDTNTQKQQKYDLKSRIPFNMTIDEVDTLLLCTVIVQEAIQKEKTNIKALQKRLNFSNVNPIYEKVGTEIFEKCTQNLDIKIVNIYMKNLTFFHNFKWRKEFDEIVKINYDKYNNYSDLRLSTQQQILMYKYQKIEQLYTEKLADDREMIDKENQKLKIGKIDMESIPTSFKLMIFLVILILLFGGVFYLLKTLVKKPKDKKKKEKKKKNQ
jgi:hypothetical protein